LGKVLSQQMVSTPRTEIDSEIVEYQRWDILNFSIKKRF